MSRVNVALVHKRIGQVGGLETRLKNYANFFRNRGDSVTIFCYKQDLGFNLPDGIEVRRIHLGAMPKPYRSWYFNHKLNRIFNPYEFDFSLALGRTSQQKACLAPGDHLGFLKAKRKKGRKPKDLVQINLDKLSFKNSQIIFPCSELVRDNLAELYQVPADKMFVLLPPLDVGRFNRKLQNRKAELRKKYSMSPHKKTFVVVSTAHKRKGIPLLINLFKELKHLPIELKIAGTAKRRLRRNAPQNVEFIGYVKKPEELFTAADFCIHPAVYEPFGQVISESLACGTPVLISENTGWSKSLPETYGRVVKGLELNNWKAAVEEAITQEFNIPTDFSSIYKLSLEDHMERMLSVYHNNVQKLP